MGRLSPQVNLGGWSQASQTSLRYHHHLSRPGLAFSHKVPMCWWSQKQKVGSQEARWCVQGCICWECEAGHGGPLTQSLLCLPWQLDCILTLLESSHPPPPLQQPTCWTPGHPAPGKSAPGGAKKRLWGSSSKGQARERLGNGLAVLGVWVGLTGHSPAEEAVARWIPGHTPCSRRGSSKPKDLQSPKPLGLVQLCPDQPALEIWPALSGLLSCVVSALTTAQLHPGFSRSWGSDPQSHQCPRATDLLEAIGCADSNEVFLRDKRGILVSTLVGDNLGDSQVAFQGPFKSPPFWPERRLSRQRCLQPSQSSTHGSHMVEGQN